MWTALASPKYSEKMRASKLADMIINFNLTDSDLERCTFFSTPSNTSVSTVLSWASSTMIAEYLERDGSDTASLKVQPNIISIQSLKRESRETCESWWSIARYTCKFSFLQPCNRINIWIWLEQNLDRLQTGHINFSIKNVSENIIDYKLFRDRVNISLQR